MIALGILHTCVPHVPYVPALGYLAVWMLLFAL